MAKRKKKVVKKKRKKVSSKMGAPRKYDEPKRTKSWRFSVRLLGSLEEISKMEDVGTNALVQEAIEEHWGIKS